jgi:hypothetical protein
MASAAPSAIRCANSYPTFPAVQNIIIVFQTHFEPHQHSLDNTCAANIGALKALANKLIEKQSGDLDELCDTLVSK